MEYVRDSIARFKINFILFAFRKKVYQNIEQLQKDLDEWINWYNTDRTHSGKYCYGKTPWQTFLDSKHLAKEKQLDQLPWNAEKLHSVDNSLLGNKSEGLANEGNFASEPINPKKMTENISSDK